MHTGSAQFCGCDENAGWICQMHSKSFPGTFSLMTDEYNTMTGAWEDPDHVDYHPLKATIFEEAVVEAMSLFNSLKSYKVATYDGTVSYPCNPRVVWTPK